MYTEFSNKRFQIQIWNNGYIGCDVAIDTETEYVTDFHHIPRIATCQAFAGDSVYYIPIDKLDAFFTVHKNSNLIFHNAPFDLDVLCKAMETRHYFKSWIDSEKLWDTSIMYRLTHLASIGFIPPRYSLALLTQKFLNEELDKNKDIRCNFGEFIGKPITAIPEQFLIYGARDVIATLLVYKRLKNHIFSYDSDLTHEIQIKGAIALDHIYKNGIGFNLEARAKFLDAVEPEMAYLREIMGTYGYVFGQKGNKEAYENIIRYFGIDLPLTEDGSLSMASDDLSSYTNNQFIAAFLRHQELKKARDFIFPLTESVIHPKYDLLKNTGRTGCSKPNFQNLPKEGGIRQMYRAQPGNVFIMTDYSAIELVTLAQTTFMRYGESVMRDRINEGADLHKYYASVMNGVSIDQVTKQQRQEAKAANFGFAGGLGIDKFITFSKGYGLDLTAHQAQMMKNAWFEAYPEMRLYMNEEEPDESTWTITGRRRANATFCARKNTPFQGLAADGAKLALYKLDISGFTLRGFVHDEIITECRAEDADKMLKLQEQIMIEEMRKVTPDVMVTVESTISPVYTK